MLLKKSLLLFASMTLVLALSACGTDDYFGPFPEEESTESGHSTEAAERQDDASDFADALPEVTVQPDGTVEVGSNFYESVEAYHRSEDFQTQGRRCGTHHNFTPQLLSTQIDSGDCAFNFTAIKAEYQPDAVYEIPVVFHVIERTNGTGHIPQSLIHSQVDVLNEDFQALPNSPGADGFDARIRFVLATEDPAGNPTTGINYYTNNSWFRDPGSGVSPMKAALNWDPDRYLNIYTNDGAGALGYATFPQTSAGHASDGVVLAWNTVGRNAPNGGLFNQGRTATHEVGHYLGLFHTFEGGCGNPNQPYRSGDLIADTVAHSGPDYQCTTRASQCGGGNNPIENYMNYSPDACMHRFTPEQANRMRCSLIHYRPDLYTVSGGSSGGSPEPAPPSPEPSAPDALSSDQALTGLSGATGDELHFYIDVPAYSAHLNVEIFGGSGDADLYVRYGSAPAQNQFDCRPYDVGNDEVCSFDAPPEGRWYIMVRGYQAFAQVNLVATITPVAQTGPGGGGLQPQTAEATGLSAATGQELRYSIDLPAGVDVATFEITGGTGDADLYLRHGAAPTTSHFDHRPYLVGNEESVTIDQPASGTWHIMIHAYEAFAGLTLRVVYQ